MKKATIAIAGLTLACSSAVFAQSSDVDSNSNAINNRDLSTANGSINQAETAGDVHSTTVGDVTYNPASPVASSSKKRWASGVHATNDTVSSGTTGQPAGNTTGMSGSGPGVPANANGMGTTPR